jgi:hypothetical protein
VIVFAVSKEPLVPTVNPASIQRRLTAVRRSPRALDRALSDFAVSMTSYKPAAAPTRATGRRRPKLSVAGRAALKLQGQYMGHMRQLKPAQKAVVRSIKAKSGTMAAIRTAHEQESGVATLPRALMS